jgi:hypothetical protein
MLIKNLMGQNYLNSLDNCINELDYRHCIDTSGTNLNSDFKNSFSSIIYAQDMKHIFSDYFIHILFTALDRQNQILNELYRIRVGLCFRTPKPINHGEHIDYSGEFLEKNLKLRTGLYYVNDSSGETHIYREKEQTKYNSKKKFNLLKTIKPVRNIWYDFNGRKYHNSVSPTENDYRLVITYNYSIKHDEY